MPRAVPIRTDISAAELRRRAKIETDGRASRRMLALAAALEGASREDAARLAGMDRQSLRDWVHRFNAEGIEGLHDRLHTGRPSRLSEGQMAAFRAVVLRAGYREGRAELVDGQGSLPHRRETVQGQLQRERSCPVAWCN